MDAPIEDVIIAFKSDIVDQDKTLKDFKCILGLTEESKLFSLQKSGGLQEIISFIHGCLNTSKHRGEGFMFLEKLVKQCVTDVFSQNATTWIRFIIQAIESHDTGDVKSLACRVGCQILPLTVNFTALAKEVIGLLPPLLNDLISASNEWRKYALDLLCTCVKSYPGPCGTLKGKMESMVTELLKEEITSLEAIRLYVLLAGSGGGGNKGFKHTEAWTYKCQQVLHSLNDVISLLYDGQGVQDTTTKYNVPAFPMKSLPDNYTSRFNTLASYFHTYCLCLQELISQPFSAPVKLPMTEIVDLVARVLTVDVKDLLVRPSTERLLLSGYISTVHSDAVLCLRTLIARCETLLLPQAKVITSLLVKELLWSRVKVTYGQNRAYSQLRITVYQTITQWLQITQSFIVSTEEDVWLLQEILHDSTPHIDNVTISSKKDKKSTHFEPPPAKKKKKGGYSELSHGISSQKKKNMTADSDLCCAALEALNHMISVVGCQLRKKLIEDVQEFVVSTALTFRSRGNHGIPYTDERCRLCLLKVMQSINLLPHPSAASILQYSLLILRSTSQDASLKISAYSIESLQMCEALIHARAPCFHSPKLVTQSKPINGHSDWDTSDKSSMYRPSGEIQSDHTDDNAGLKCGVLGLKGAFIISPESVNKPFSMERSIKETVLKSSYDLPKEDERITSTESVKSNKNDTKTKFERKTSSAHVNANIKTIEKLKDKSEEMDLQEENIHFSKAKSVTSGKNVDFSKSYCKGQDNADVAVAMETDEVQVSTENETVKTKEEKGDKPQLSVLSNEDQENLDDMLCAFVDADTDN